MIYVRTVVWIYLLFFFFNDTATTEIYTLSLHDALPIYPDGEIRGQIAAANISVIFADLSGAQEVPAVGGAAAGVDRKSTRLNSSHGYISYAVFCLKKKKKILVHAYYHY